MAQSKILHRPEQHLLRIVRKHRIALDLLFAQLSIESPLASGPLAFKRFDHFGMHRRRIDGRDILRVALLHLNIDLDTVEQRIGDTLLVALDLQVAATARVNAAKKVAARAGILRRHEHEPSGVFDLAVDTRYEDPMVLQRLAKRFEHHLLKMGKFIEEEKPTIRQGHFADTGTARTAAEDTGLAR